MPFSQWIVDAQKHRKLLVVPAKLGVAFHPGPAICSLLYKDFWLYLADFWFAV